MSTNPAEHPATLRGLMASPLADAVLSLLPVLLAGAAYLGLAGMALGLGFALSATDGRWPEEVWFGPVIGFPVGAHCGLWAGLVYALAPPARRILFTTLAAGLSEPAIWNFWEGYDPPFHWQEWAVSTLVYGLPFLCGWLFARAMSGHTRLPLLERARAALASGHLSALTVRPRILACLFALALGYAAVAVATVAVAVLGYLLPLAPSEIPEGVD